MSLDYDARSDASSQNTKLPYVLLKPVKTDKPPREAVEIYNSLQTVYKLKQILEGITGLIAVDIETNGTQAADPNTKIVGIGIASAERILYFARPACSDSVWAYLLEWLANPELTLVGHNIFFDSAFLKRDSGKDYNWRFCTYGLYRQLASEGWPGQKWGLKTAQVELLGWQDTNQAELTQWLVDNNYISSVSKEPKEGSVYLPETERYAKPDYSQMYRAPAAILGYYCGLDAASTYMLLTEVMLPAIDRLPPQARDLFYWYHGEVFITNVKLNVEQQLRGILIDKDKLTAHNTWLLEEIQRAEQSFIQHPEIAPKIQKYNQQILQEHLAAEPEKFLKLKLPREPKIKVKKNGEISKAWLQWEQNYKAALVAGPAVSKNWLKWSEKTKIITDTNHFNINSGLQRQWLFYEELGYPVKLRTPATDANPSGQPATDKKALLGFGEPGKLLKYSNDLVKEQGYVAGCLEHLIDSKIHPQMRVPGTLTLRLAGSGGINLQQVPKSRRYLECYTPRPGYAWIDCDIHSLEQVVLTELSRDNSLMKLYGPGANKNQDVYLFNGAQLPVIGPKIRAAGYNPDSPTKEGTARAKKEAKKERSIAKVVTLASSYGAGANKIKQTLELEGIQLSDYEAKQIHAAYWDLYSGVKRYEKYLLSEYDKRGGWVYSGLGLPSPIYVELKKDIINRVVQRTGHDILMLINYELEQLRRVYFPRILFYPVIIDFHDESIVECREEDAPAVIELFKEAYRRVNEWLGGSIPIVGEPEIIYSLADDWEIEEKKIEITRSQLSEAFNAWLHDPQSGSDGATYMASRLGLDE